MTYKYDFLVIGAGIAGMSYALKVAQAKKGKVCIICKTTLDEANTRFAQGGVASVTILPALTLGVQELEKGMYQADDFPDNVTGAGILLVGEVSTWIGGEAGAWSVPALSGRRLPARRSCKEPITGQ